MYSETINLAKFNPEINSRFCSCHPFTSPAASITTCTRSIHSTLSLYFPLPFPSIFITLHLLDQPPLPTLYLHPASTCSPFASAAASITTRLAPYILPFSLLFSFLPLYLHRPSSALPNPHYRHFVLSPWRIYLPLKRVALTSFLSAPQSQP